MWKVSSTGTTSVAVFALAMVALVLLGASAGPASASSRQIQDLDRCASVQTDASSLGNESLWKSAPPEPEYMCYRTCQIYGCWSGIVLMQWLCGSPCPGGGTFYAGCIPGL